MAAIRKRYLSRLGFIFGEEKDAEGTEEAEAAEESNHDMADVINLGEAAAIHELAAFYDACLSGNCSNLAMDLGNLPELAKAVRAIEWLRAKKVEESERYARGVESARAVRNRYLFRIGFVL